MGLLPTPRDYAAREAARHCRSLADHLLDADPMARPAPPPRHPSPPRPVHRPTRPHDTPPSLGRCGGLRSLSRGGVTRPGSAGRGSARRASAPCGGSTTSSCARCSAAPPNPHPTPHRCTPRSTVSSLPCLPPNQVLCWTDFRTRSAAHCASKVLGVGLGLGLGLGCVFGSRKGTWEARLLWSARALMQLPSASRERLMLAPSVWRIPTLSVLAARSLPARSIMLSLPGEGQR